MNKRVSMIYFAEDMEDLGELFVDVQKSLSTIPNLETTLRTRGNGNVSALTVTVKGSRYMVHAGLYRLFDEVGRLPDRVTDGKEIAEEEARPYR